MYALIAAGVLAALLAGSGWLHLHNAKKWGEEKGVLAGQVVTATAAAEANAEMTAWEREARERAQRIAARNHLEKQRLEGLLAAENEETFNVAPDQNGPIAPVLRRALDRLPERAAGAAASGEVAPDDGGSSAPAADAEPHAPGG